jgi:hypothetical protein
MDYICTSGSLRECDLQQKQQWPIQASCKVVEVLELNFARDGAMQVVFHRDNSGAYFF